MDGMADIGIRTATDGDERALAAIDYATWSTHVSPAPLWPRETPFFDDRTTPENVLLAHADSAVLGYVKLRPSPMPASSGHVQEINGFAVGPNHQGRGIGHLLLDAARIEAIERRARSVSWGPTHELSRSILHTATVSKADSSASSLSEIATSMTS